MSGTLQPAWVLHRRAYGDGGYLVELLTLETGRLTALLRGAQRKSRGGSTGGLAQPFTPLLIEFFGRGELKTLKRVEAAGPGITLPGRALFSGLYVNELLTRLLPRYDPHPALFARYGNMLPSLGKDGEELALRALELALLDELGYGLMFGVDAHGHPIEPTERYRFDPAHGFVARRFEDATGAAQSAWSGEMLLALEAWWSEPSTLGLDERRALKLITRMALANHLGDRPLRSRELLKSFVQGQRPLASASPTTVGTTAGEPHS